MELPALTDLNWLAILAATLTNMVWGMLWYTPFLFGNVWMRLAHPGKTEEDLRNGPKTGYVVALVGAFVMAIVLAVLLRAGGASGVVDGLLMGVLVWAGFVATTFAQAYVFGGKPFTLWAIDSGFNLPVLLTMGAILAAWV